MRQNATNILRSPVTILVLIIIIGITFGLTLKTNIQQATYDRQRSELTKVQVAKNTHALCAFIEPAILTFDSPASRASTEANQTLLEGLLESHTTVGCTPNMTDGN